MSSRRSPFQDMQELFDRMSRQLQEAAQMWGVEGEGGPTALPGRSSMSLDVVEEEDAYVATADVPGFETDDIHVRVTDSTLHIEAESESESEAGDESYIRRERSRRSMRRSVRLPERVSREEVEATLQNGVLTVTIPKTEPAEGGEEIRIQEG